MIRTLYEDEDVSVIDINMNSIMKLKCGCTVLLQHLMIVMGRQVKHQENVQCPHHLIEHDFSDNVIMKAYSLQYYEQCLSESDEPLITVYPPHLLR